MPSDPLLMKQDGGSISNPYRRSAEQHHGRQEEKQQAGNSQVKASLGPAAVCWPRGTTHLRPRLLQNVTHSSGDGLDVSFAHARVNGQRDQASVFLLTKGEVRCLVPVAL